MSSQEQLRLGLPVEALDVTRVQEQRLVAVLAAAAVVLEGQVGGRAVGQEGRGDCVQLRGTVPQADVPQAFCIGLSDFLRRGL